MSSTGSRRRVAASALSVAALTAAALIAGCGATTSSSSQAAAPAQSSSASPAAPATAGGVARPGSSYSIGQAATVAFIPPTQKTTTPQTTLKVTVRSIQKGTLADFKGILLDAQQRAGTPQYVTVKISNIGSRPAQSATVGADVQGIDKTGNVVQSVTIVGDFPRCNDRSSQAPIAPGQSLDTCLLYLVPGGITKVAYTGTDAYIDSPVTWK